MTTYTTVPNSDIDQDSPVTQPLLTALRDNPLAIAEGTSGAPKISPLAFSGFYLGYSSATSGAWTTTFTFPATSKLLFIEADLKNVASGQSFQVEFSADGGVTWGATQSLLSGFTGPQSSKGTIDVVTGAVDGRSLNSFTPTANANAARFRSSTQSVQIFVWLVEGVA